MEKCIYICSAPRSGSTLLDMMLSGHSKINSLGEFSFIGKTINMHGKCSCGAEICQCSQWKKVFTTINNEKQIDLCTSPYALMQWDAITHLHPDKTQQTKSYFYKAKLRSIYFKLRLMLPKIIRPALQGKLKQWVANSFYFYDAVSTAWDSPILVDSSKNYNHAIALHDRAPDKVKVIFLVRDGRGTFYSFLRRKVPQKIALDNWLIPNRRSYAYLTKHIPENDLLLVRYEDLVSKPEEIIQKICDFSGIQYEAQMLELSPENKHLVNGNYRTMTNFHKGLKIDDAWKTEMSSKDKAFFEKQAGQLNKQLGYK